MAASKYSTDLLDQIRAWRFDGVPVATITEKVSERLGETVTWEGISRAVRRFGGWNAEVHLGEQLANAPSCGTQAGWLYREKARSVQRVIATARKLKIMVIPDTQVKQGVPTNHIAALGRYIKAKRPDIIVMLGDWYDMPSLSTFDENRGAMEGRRYLADIQAGNDAIDALEANMHGDSKYLPRKVFILGNHEYRIKRYVENYPKLEGLMGYHNFAFQDYGWELHEFREVVEIEGILFSHLFAKNSFGRVTPGAERNGASSAMAQLRANMQSCIAGHRQGIETAEICVGRQRKRSIIAGSFYQHDEEYMGPQGNDYWRGVLMLHEVHDGNFDLLEVSMDYLLREYYNV